MLFCVSKEIYPLNVTLKTFRGLPYRQSSIRHTHSFLVVACLVDFSTFITLPRGVNTAVGGGAPCDVSNQKQKIYVIE